MKLNGPLPGTATHFEWKSWSVLDLLSFRRTQKDSVVRLTDDSCIYDFCCVILGDTPSTSQGHEELVSPSNTVLFREIHKNAWLRKLPSIDKRSGAVPKVR